MTMREKIARAIAGRDRPPFTLPWDRMPHDERDLYLGDADAVLDAMREPTEAMVEAGYRAMMHTDFTGPQERNCWQAMIDVAKVGEKG